MKKLMGIYKFENKKTGEVYIGQSVDLFGRYEQHIASSSDDKFHKALREYGTENFTWEILEQAESFTKEELNLMEVQYIDRYNSKSKGYNSTVGNHAELDKACREYMKSHMHYVNADLSKEVLRFANVSTLGIDAHAESVLILGQGYYVNWLAAGNNVTVVSDSANYKCEDKSVEIITVENIKNEYEEVLNKLSNRHFDLIIANPPYKKIGAEITKYIVDNIDYDQFINLMPARDYMRVEGLVGHVNPITLKKAESGFDDAIVDTWMAEIVKRPFPMTKEIFELRTYDEKLMKCYEVFAEREHYAIDEYKYELQNAKTEEACMELTKAFDPKYDFLITLRTNQDGVHKVNNAKPAFDVRWNIFKDVSWENFHRVYDKSSKKWHTTYSFIHFDTEVEHDNFARWWYNGGLSNMLVKGLNKTSGSCKSALPKVDWTRPWTDEEILRDCGYTEEEIEELLK